MFNERLHHWTIRGLGGLASRLRSQVGVVADWMKQQPIVVDAFSLKYGPFVNALDTTFVLSKHGSTKFSSCLVGYNRKMFIYKGLAGLALADTEFDALMLFRSLILLEAKVTASPRPRTEGPVATSQKCCNESYPPMHTETCRIFWNEAMVFHPE